MALNNAAFLAPILYTEIIVTIENAEDGSSLNNGRFTLQSLKDHGNVTIDTGMIGFWVDSNYLPEYVKILITVHGKNVMNSPIEIHIKKQEEFFQDISIIPNGGSAQEQNHFQDLSMGENVTRTGKRTDDLDESDARAIGKKHALKIYDQLTSSKYRSPVWRQLLRCGFLTSPLPIIVSQMMGKAVLVHLFCLARTPEKRICLRFRLAIYLWIYPIPIAQR